jgi:protein gp37
MERRYQMSKDTKIQWTDVTWNIAVGCTKVDEDCKYCYMYRGSLNNTRYDPKVVRKTKTVFNLPLKIKEPSKIFVSSLTDVFHPECDSFRNEMWDIIRKCPQHTFQILTKRPERIREHLPADWGDGWDNVWLGTSVGSMKGRHRINELLMAPKAKVKFLSLEPLHEKVYLTSIKEYCDPCYSFTTNSLTGITSEWDAMGKGGIYDHGSTQGDKIDWVIVGGESGNENGKYQYRPCEFEWIEYVVNDCKYAGVPVFVKQLGTHLAKELKLKDRHGGDITEWPESLQIREFPVERKGVDYV